jgi:hypothetical protein
MSKEDKKKKAPAKKAEAKVEKTVTAGGVTFTLETWPGTKRVYWKSDGGWRGTYATEAEAMKDKPKG